MLFDTYYVNLMGEIMNAKAMEAGMKMMKAPTAGTGSAGAATAAPLAKAGGSKAAAVPAAKAGGSVLTSGKLLAATKAAVATPMFGIAALSSIIVFQWWKGKRDARQFSSSEG
jgi:hypothetical protein